MGKRSRKRASGSGLPAGRPPLPERSAPPASGASRRAHAVPTDRRARASEAPPAPWSPFPLVELGILAGLICILVGYFAGGERRVPLLVIGFALVCLSAIELSVREHFAGFRSHTTLLAAVAGVLAAVPLYVATALPQEVLLIAAVLVFLVVFGVLRAAFARRAGGLSFRA